MHELIRRQAQAQPDALALIAGEASLSYAELDARANRLAHRLLAEGLGRESRVALLLPRGIEAILAMLAVLKAGAAYLPLDPEQPAQRLAELIADAGVSLILHQDYLRAQPTWLNLAELDLSNQPATPPEVKIHPEQLAYLILTSGSTGKPKCVAVAHGALTRHIQAAGDLYRYTPADRALHFAAFTFDAAMEQWLAPLCYGAGVVLGFSRWTGDDTLDSVQTHGVTVVYPPTSALLHLADAVSARGQTLALRIACVGGEAVSSAALAKLRAALQPEMIVNGYGPTETVITPLAWQADAREVTGYAPIGTALGERSLYILDPNLNPVPLGAVGELYLGGPCLARGYFGRAGLTAERFIPDPFGADGGRLYRTGDLVRFGLDGIVAYLGRADQQIKLRGYRIEPGEIEAALRQLPGVDDAHVLLRDDNGRRYLAAYLQPGPHGGIATDEAIKTALAARLPDYMVPARFIRLAQLPRTAHGKIDRRALPVPDAPARREPQAPTHPTEAVLVQLWQDLLGRHDIGIHDNFFELGGDSIISIQLVSRARAQGLRFTPKDLFQQQTIAGLAQVVQRLNLDDPEQTEQAQAPATGPAPLLPIQHVFFEQQLSTPAHWNQSLLLKARRPLDRAALEPALHTLVEHHDSLRLRYVQKQGQWQQRYAEIQPAESLLEQHLVQDAAHITAIAQQAQRSLNLEHGPLFKAVLIDVADGSQRLLLVAHHLIVDAVSWRLLLEDLHRLYQQIRQGQAPQLPAKTASYQAWGRALQNYAQSPGLQAQRGYWQAQGEDQSQTDTSLCNWPCDHPQGRAEARDRVSQTLTLSAERSRQLLHDANPAYRTRIQELLLAALAQTLCEWTRQTDIAVALEGHGREAELMPSDNPQAALDLSRTVGWFTSLYPVKLSPQTSEVDTVKTVKEQLRRVPDRGLGYGVLHYLSPTNQHPADARHEASVNPARPRVLFNYLGQLDSSFSDDALLQPAAEDSGDERDPQTPLAYELEINGEIYQGQLRLHWSYSRERYQADTIKTLLERYQLHLNRLLDHCLQAEPTLTPSDVPLANLSQAQLDALPIPHAQIEDVYPLSPMQQGMLFHALQHGEQDPYFYQRVFSLNGALDVARFHVAWQTAVDRRPALRSSYLFEDMQLPLQVVGKSRSVELRQADWRGLDADQHWRQLHSWLADERKQGFDFAGRRGFELSLLRVGDARWWLVWSHHHIALDGWSMGLVLRDVMRAYHDDAPVSQPDYADYLRWLASRDHAAALAFWRESLQGFNGSTPLPLPAEAMPAGERGSYREIETSLSIDETAQVQAAARRHGVTVSTLLQAAYALLLVRHGGGEALFGVTVSGRSANVDGIDEMAGLFINTLPLRVSLPGARDVTSWLQAIQRQAAAMRDYEFTPLVEIQRAAGCEGQNLFEAILVFENYPLDEVLKSQRDGLQVGLLDAEAPAGVLRHDLGRNNYPLSLIAGLDNHLHLTLSGERQRFLPGALELLAKRYRYLLQQLITVGVTTLADIQLQPLPAFSLAVADGEIALLSGVDVARGELDYPHVLAAWESHVIAQPDAIAVRDSIASLSFAELNRSAARLAAVLQGMGVNTETVVGVLFERSVQLPLSLLAVLKAGGVYLPLDPALPDSRLHDLLRDSGATVLLTGDADAPRFANCGVAVLNPDAVARTDGVAEFAAMPIHAEQAAYRIYTSGSTGHPKGVTVSHGALDRYLQGVLPRLDWPRTAILAMVSTPAADLSHTVLFGAMYSGCALVLIDAETAADPDRFAAAMRENQVDVLKIVPSHLRGLLQAANPADVLPNRLLILGGEACDAELLATVRRLKPGCRIVNHYGPTETTVGVLTHEVTAEAAPIVPVGTPLAGTCAYLLDADLNPLPNDVPGELYIGGGSLARAYHGKPGASAERFLPDPFHAGARMYRTGDRAILRGGRLVWLGRADDQVKIRGYRVEPGEVAKVLRGLPGVADALVIAEPNEQDGRLQLLAYAVAERAASLDITNLNTQLAALLPDYMLPAHLMVLEAIPLTANGKANRKALPRPQAKARSSVAPRNDTESKLAAIWQTVLKREPIGVTDNFFELGGDSILSLQIIARARKQGIKLTPKLLFERPTIAELAAAGAVPVAENRQTAIPRLAVEGPRPLSYGQERLWFLAQLQPDNNAYHISGGLRIHGRLDDNALRLAFQGLAKRHAMLRTHFVEVEGKPMQLADAALALPLRILTGAEAVLSKTAESNVPFDFATGPMWRVALVKYGEDRHELWLTMHHILADGLSVGRLLEEFSELYAATVEGREAHLPTLAIEYADYAAWQRQWLAAGEGERQARYWQNQLGGEQPVLELPFDHPRPERMSGAGASHAFVLPVSVGQRLKQVAVQSDTTPFVVLFAAFAALLYRYSGQPDIRIGVPVANRQRLETEPVLGFFVNTLVIKAECRGDRRFQDWLAQAKQTVLAAQEHPDLPFEHLAELLQPERTMNRNPLFQVLFNHQKRDLSALNALPGLNIERIVSEPAAAQFDLSLATEEDDDGVFSGSFVYAAELFLPETITRLSEHFQRLLAGCLAEADQPLAGVDLLSEAERVHQSSCNATETAYPPGLAHELISQTATVQPAAPALLFGDAAMSYAELESRANRLAHYLIDLGVGPEMPVGIAVERSFELVVGLLAIVKAGGAYVPLDPDYPDERLAYMIEDSGIGLLLSHGAVIDKFRAICSTSEKECVAYDLDNSDVSGFPGSAPLANLNPSHPAYIIYTSGSTGRPKGATNTHAALANRLRWMQQAYAIGPNDTVLQKTPFSFDVSVWEFFWPLMTGARLAIAAPGAHRDPAALADTPAAPASDDAALRAVHAGRIRQPAKSAEFSGLETHRLQRRSPVGRPATARIRTSARRRTEQPVRPRPKPPSTSPTGPAAPTARPAYRSASRSPTFKSTFWIGT
nr:non-ribosomal peptide synthetase [Methylosarcina fibrata]